MVDIKNEKEIPWRDGDSGPKYLFKGPKIDGGLILYKPGQKLGKHYHNEVEETFFIMEGTPTFIIGDERVETKPGDVFSLPPKTPHDIINEGSENCKIFFIKAPYIPDDKVKM
ncbi:MAG: cupin domain-containing protein [Candidatus Helarchaeota archaeon]